MRDDFYQDEDFHEYPELPISVRDIAETLGIEVVIKLVQHFGGTRFMVPKKLKPHHQINVLGEEKAQAFCDYLGGEQIEIPRRLKKNPVTARQITDLEKQGLTRVQIARKLGVSLRHIRRTSNAVLSAPSKEQLKLF